MKEFKNIFLSNNMSKIVGFTPNYIGTRPVKKIFQNKEFLQYFLDDIIRDKNFEMENKFPNVYKALCESLQETRINFTGGYQSNSNHLIRLLNTKDINIYKDEELINICKMSGWFDIPVCKFEDPTEMYSLINFNPKSSPGIFTSLIYGTFNKRGTVEPSLLLANYYFRLARKIPLKNFSLYEVLGREKDIKLEGEDTFDNCSTRVVLNPEHFFTIINSWVFQKVMTTITNSSKNSKYLTFLIDKEYDGRKAYEIYDKIINKHDMIIDSDWSYFDATISEQYLRVALSIMLSESYFNDEDKRFLNYIIQGAVTKYIAIPSGIVVETKRSGPSGHPGITAINCFVNLIRWSVIGYELYGPEFSTKMTVTLYGDDGFIGLDFIDEIVTPDIDSVLIKHGFKSDTMNDKLFLSKNYFLDINNTPDFLKRRIFTNGISWNKKKIFDKILYPSNTRSLEDNCQILIDYIQTGPGDDELNNFFLSVLEKIGKSNPLLIKYHDKLLEILANNKLNRFKLNYGSFIDEIKYINNSIIIHDIQKYIDFNNNIPNLSKFRVDMFFPFLWGFLVNRNFVNTFSKFQEIHDFEKVDTRFFYLTEEKKIIFKKTAIFNTFNTS